MIDRAKLDLLYRRYNRRAYVEPDPLQFLYEYSDTGDREVSGLVASALAYGRVAQILRSVRIVLAEMGCSPRAFLLNTSDGRLKRIFADFRHRFTGCRELTDLMIGARRVISGHGSLNAAFLADFKASDETVLPAMRVFAARLRCESSAGSFCLIPDPLKGSACKRLNLFLRWMVRKDAVDPGGWVGVPKSKLIVPLDTHMSAIGRGLGLTRRNGTGMGAALDITRSFRALSLRDPVKYDFALTRFGIRPDLKIADLISDVSP